MAEWEPKRPWGVVDYVSVAAMAVGALLVLLLVIKMFSR
ncbi:hypothetical protein BH10ACT10_BH10ACT10_01880 [soil metagenome]